MHDIANEIELASVLSGNRNFEGRISTDVSQNYLCAPALVIAPYSLAGTIDFDLKPKRSASMRKVIVFTSKISGLMTKKLPLLLEKSRTKEVFDRAAVGLFDGDEKMAVAWQGSEAMCFAWDPDSTYVRRAPYFDGYGEGSCSAKRA